jgi:hypothetical protein
MQKLTTLKFHGVPLDDTGQRYASAACADQVLDQFSGYSLADQPSCPPRILNLTRREIDDLAAYAIPLAQD